MYTIITPRTCAGGKAIGRVIVIIVVNQNIAKPGDLGTWASCKRNKSVEFGEN